MLLSIVVASMAMVAWDVFLDTQMVAAGNWGWQYPEPSLLGTPGIPITNYLGWFVVSVCIMSFIWMTTRRKPSSTKDSRLYPLYVIYFWTWIGSMIANVTFWGRPHIALAGGVAMGSICMALTIRWCVDFRRRQASRDRPS